MATMDYLAVISVLVLLPGTEGFIFWPSRAGNMTIFSPIYTRIHPKELGRVKTFCTDKTFGLSGVKVPVCRVFSYKFGGAPTVKYKMGRLRPQVTQALLKQYNFLRPRPMADSRSRPLPHDGDMCCPTVRSLREAPYRMTDPYGSQHDIIHFPEEGLFQFYHGGSCLDANENVYCHGTCVEEKSTIYLAVFRFESDFGFSFEPFEVPSYCSCKNIVYTQQRSPQRFNKNETAPDM